jgi:RNase adapter protein RapZ
MATSASITLITGYSGAGKSTALKVFEDQGYYCVENLPGFLLAELVEGLAVRGGNPSRIAVVTDIRDPAFPRAHIAILSRWRAEGRAVTVLFLEASEDMLLRRYSQVRRVHPLATSKALREGLRLEREQLTLLRESADCIIDSSDFTVHELRQRLLDQISSRPEERILRISFISFGYKHGPPVEADLLFDVRFLANPYFISELTAKSGLEADVATYVLDNDCARNFFSLLLPLLAFLIPQYRREGKAYLTIGIGCTGGRHRSVAVAEEMARVLGAAGERVILAHRDLARNCETT